MSDRLPVESAQAFEAYKAYRDIGPERSIDKAWRRLKKLEASSKRAPSFWMQWATRHDWSKRAQAHDDRLDAIELAATEKRHAQLGRLKADLDFEVFHLRRRRIRNMEPVLDKYEAAPVTDLFNHKTETVKGLAGEPDKVVDNVTRIKGVKGGDYAKIAKAQADIAELAIAPRVKPGDAQKPAVAAADQPADDAKQRFLSKLLQFRRSEVAG